MKKIFLIFTLIISGSSLAKTDFEQQHTYLMMLKMQKYAEIVVKNSNDSVTDLDGNKSDTLTEEITFVVENQVRAVKGG